MRAPEAVDPAHALEAMRAALPPEMPVHRCRLVDDKHPALMARLMMADYRIGIMGADAGLIADEVPKYMAEGTVMAVRKTKSGEKEVNIRPLTISLEADGNAILARLMLTPEDTLKPDLLLSVLASRAGAVDYEGAIYRTALLGTNDSGSVVGLMEL